MAKRVDNSKDFLVIAMTPREAMDICEFGFKNVPNYEDDTVEDILICDKCNDLLSDESYTKEVYYVAVLNRLFCKRCYDNFIASATRYDEDMPIEEDYFNTYAKLLGI